MKVLIERHRLECTLQMFHGKYPRIYIKAASIPLLGWIVAQHMDASISYKIGVVDASWLLMGEVGGLSALARLFHRPKGGKNLLVFPWKKSTYPLA